MNKTNLIALYSIGLISISSAFTSAYAGKDNIVASVNGVAITRDEIDSHLQQVPAFMLQTQGKALEQKLIQRLIEQQLILQDAEKNGVTKTAQYKQKLNNVIDAMTYNFVLEQTAKNAISDELLEEEYTRIKYNFAQDKVKARHILVKTEDEAKALIVKLDSGANFEELAKEFSIGPSKTTGGDLGWFTRGQMVKPFEDVAFNMEPFSYSKTPVKTQFGYHIILVEDSRTNEPPALEEMRGQLEKSLSEKAVSNYITKLRENADIEYAK